jgi:hypothetical protein
LQSHFDPHAYVAIAVAVPRCIYVDKEDNTLHGMDADSHWADVTEANISQILHYTLPKARSAGLISHGDFKPDNFAYYKTNRDYFPALTDECGLVRIPSYKRHFVLIDYAWSSSINVKTQSKLVAASIPTMSLSRWSDPFHRCTDVAQLAWGILEVMCHLSPVPLTEINDLIAWPTKWHPTLSTLILLASNRPDVGVPDGLDGATMVRAIWPLEAVTGDARERHAIFYPGCMTEIHADPRAIALLAGRWVSQRPPDQQSRADIAYSIDSMWSCARAKNRVALRLSSFCHREYNQQLVPTNIPTPTISDVLRMEHELAADTCERQQPGQTPATTTTTD